MSFELGDKVKLLDDDRVAVIMGVLEDPMKGGNFDILKGGFGFIINTPKRPIAPKQFTDDNGYFTNEPVYYIQGEGWWSWAVAHELSLDKPVQRKLL